MGKREHGNIERKKNVWKKELEEGVP